MGPEHSPNIGHRVVRSPPPEDAPDSTLDRSTGCDSTNLVPCGTSQPEALMEGIGHGEGPPIRHNLSACNPAHGEPGELQETTAPMGINQDNPGSQVCEKTRRW